MRWYHMTDNVSHDSHMIYHYNNYSSRQSVSVYSNVQSFMSFLQIDSNDCNIHVCQKCEFLKLIWECTYYALCCVRFTRNVCALFEVIEGFPLSGSNKVGGYFTQTAASPALDEYLLSMHERHVCTCRYTHTAPTYMAVFMYTHNAMCIWFKTTGV